MTALLEISDLVKTYGTGETETRVLRGLDLRLEQGELSALVGPSGSGKSTLLTILGTLMKPTSGAYAMLGVDMVAADDRARKTPSPFFYYSHYFVCGLLYCLFISC